MGKSDYRITAYLLNELSAAEKAAFEKELFHNSDLLAQVEEQKKFLAAIHGEFSRVPQFELDPKHRQAINKKLYCERAPSFWKSLFSPKIGLSFASILILVGVIALIQPRLIQQEEVQNKAAPVQEIEVAKVEEKRMEPPTRAKESAPMKESVQAIGAVEAPAAMADAVATADIAPRSSEGVRPEGAPTSYLSAGGDAGGGAGAAISHRGNMGALAQMKAAKSKAIEPKSSAAMLDKGVESKKVGRVVPMESELTIEYRPDTSNIFAGTDEATPLLIACLHQHRRESFPEKVKFNFEVKFKNAGQVETVKSDNKDEAFKQLNACAVDVLTKNISHANKQSGTYSLPIIFISK